MEFGYLNSVDNLIHHSCTPFWMYVIPLYNVLVSDG